MNKYTVAYQYWYSDDENTVYDSAQIFLADGIFDLDMQWTIFIGKLCEEIPDFCISDYEIVEDVRI